MDGAPNYGYVGCIRDLFVDGQSKDVRRIAETQKATGVKPSCSKEAPKLCLSNPCQNNGVCREGWNRYVCDCSGTGYLGRSCERGEFTGVRRSSSLLNTELCPKNSYDHH